MNPATIELVANILFKVAQAGPLIFKTFNDAKPLAEGIIQSAKGKVTTADEAQALHDQITELTNAIEED